MPPGAVDEWAEMALSPVYGGRTWDCPFGEFNTCSTYSSGPVTIPSVIPGDMLYHVTYDAADWTREKPRSAEAYKVMAAPATDPDFAEDELLPLIELVSQSDDRYRPELSWSTESPPMSADMLRIHKYFTSPPGNTPIGDWNIILPPDTPSPFRLPPMPDSFLPHGVNVATADTYLELVMNSEVDGYAEAKAVAPDMFTPELGFWYLAPAYHAATSYWGTLADSFFPSFVRETGAT